MQFYLRILSVKHLKHYQPSTSTKIIHNHTVIIFERIRGLKQLALLTGASNIVSIQPINKHRFINKGFQYPPHNIIDQALAHCSHSLLQPSKKSSSYCIATRLYILSSSQRSQACKLLPHQQPNLTKLYIQHIIFYLYKGFPFTIYFLPLPLSLVRHSLYLSVRLHVSSKLLAFSRARIKLIF